MTLAEQVEKLADSALNAYTRLEVALKRVVELEVGLNRMVLAHENTESDSEGRWPQPDMGCVECTVGTVPNRLNTGLCAYHNAKKLLGQI